MKEKFSITFKNNDKEQAIKEYLNAKFNATVYIKELLYKDMLGQVEPKVAIDTETKATIHEISDEEIEKVIDDMKKAPTVSIEPTKVEIIKPQENKEFGFDPTANPF